MIAQWYRFHGHAALRFVFSRGQTVRAGGLSLRYAPNPRRQTWRAAVVVSRKVHKSAVVRNRIRRRLYELVRQELRPDGPYDLVLTVFDARLADLPADRLARDVRQLFGRAGFNR